jgi:hypothetical protein
LLANLSVPAPPSFNAACVTGVAHPGQMAGAQQAPTRSAPPACRRRRPPAHPQVCPPTAPPLPRASHGRSWLTRACRCILASCGQKTWSCAVRPPLRAPWAPFSRPFSRFSRSGTVGVHADMAAEALNMFLAEEVDPASLVRCLGPPLVRLSPRSAHHPPRCCPSSARPLRGCCDTLPCWRGKRSHCQRRPQRGHRSPRACRPWTTIVGPT